MRTLFPFLAVLYSVILSIMSAEPPFSLNETPGKLPKEVVPTEYSIRIVPNIDKFTFTGTETVKLEVRSPVHQLVLNALELDVTEPTLDGKPLSKSAAKIDKENELLTLTLPSELAPGDHTISLSFSGKINQQGQGLFYMWYQEHGSGATKVMLGTQFEATDARRFFPCWDEPVFRARFQLTAVVLENWLGITYYESALLFDPKNSSAETKQNIYEVIAHEVAHMWFGDLVTMAWWDNLWLNEGFASWMGTKCTAHFNPQWEVWLRRNLPRDPTRRVGIAKEQAMEGDARSTTHPIQQPIATEAEANSAFDDITYKKGQSFLRMLESFLGEDIFRDGIRQYIATHKYSNSTTADLWNALSEASKKPVGEIAAGWTEQPGFPVVQVK